MPILFLVGGYANATSWQRHAGAGEGWAAWRTPEVVDLATYVSRVAQDGAQAAFESGPRSPSADAGAP